MSFIVRDEAAAEELKQELASGFFQSPEMFVRLYNEGLINRGNEQVDDIAKRLPKIYKDVVLSNRTLNLLTVEEVALAEIDSSLTYWKAFVALRKAVEVAEGLIGPEEHIAFSNDASAVFGVVRRDESGEDVFVEVGQLRESYCKAIAERVGQELIPGITVVPRSVLNNADTSFIQEIWRLLPEK